MFNFRKESKQLFQLNQLNPPQVRTSSHLSAHIFNASHSTLTKASLNSPSNPNFQNRFPVNRNVLNSFKGRQISATVLNSDTEFRDKSKDVIMGHVRIISSYGFEMRINIESNTTIANSVKLLPLHPHL
jgi:hypothetical protein